MPADNPKCPPSAPSKRITYQLSYDEDPKEIPHSRDAGLEFQHIFVKELKKKKNPIDVLCSRELTGYVCDRRGYNAALPSESDLD